jgi:hypothetical protein
MVNDGLWTCGPALALMAEARHYGCTGDATTTSPVNVAALLRRAVGPEWRCNSGGATAPCAAQAASGVLAGPGRRACRRRLRRLRGFGQRLGAALPRRADTVITRPPSRGTTISAALRVLPSLAGVAVHRLVAWRAGRARRMPWEPRDETRPTPTLTRYLIEQRRRFPAPPAASNG